MPDGRGLAFWVVSDNLRKGAATNAVRDRRDVRSARATTGWRRHPRRRRRGRVTSGATQRQLSTPSPRGPGLHGAAVCRSNAPRPCRARGTRTPRSSSWARGPARTRTGRAGRSWAPPAGCSRSSSAMVGWRRDEVFITNVVKCRPPGNRDPEPDEMAACAPFLRRQLEVLDPALVVTLGRIQPADVHARRHASAGARHDTARRPGDRRAGTPPAYAMYHPAAALAPGRRSRRRCERDMAAIPEALIRAREGRATLRADAGARRPKPRPGPRWRSRTPRRTA